jgi:hypothetical protein
MNRMVKNGSVFLNTSPATRTTNTLILSEITSTGRRNPIIIPISTGIFRVVIWLDNENGTQEEVAYSVLPHPRNPDVDETSNIGIHPNFVDFQLEAVQKLGLKWARVLSPSAFFRWSNVEPEEGQFIFYDEQVQKASTYGLTILGTLGTNNYWPDWAENGDNDDNGGLPHPNLQKWENFVTAMVNHYKDSVKYWEIWNEPNYVFKPYFYAELLKRAAEVIYNSDPTAEIVGMGGAFYIDWIEDVIDYLGDNWFSYMDYISTHIYPRNYLSSKTFKESIIDFYDIPVWNTEAGAWDLGFYKGSNSNFISSGKSIWPYKEGDRYYQGALGAAKRVATSYLSSIGNGLARYIYYDSRIHASPGYFLEHPTILEYDETIRTKGIALAILASLFDTAQGMGDIINDPDTFAYLFNRNGTPLVGLWTQNENQSPKTITLTIPSYKFTVSDMMGNEISISDSAIPYNGTPIYIEGKGISVDAFRAGFQNGVISNRNDSTAPNLSICSAPTGPTTENPIKIRWFALDDTSVPSDLSPNAILYSFRLEGYDGNWSQWSPQTQVEYNIPTSGTYVFSVKAKDEAGNISAIVSRSISIEALPVFEPDITATDSIAPIDDRLIPFANLTVRDTAIAILTLTNDGTAPLTIGNIQAANTLDGPFSIDDSACSGLTLTDGQSCDCTVSFEPTETGTFTDAIGIPSNDPDTDPLMVQVSGSGVEDIPRRRR